MSTSHVAKRVCHRVDTARKGDAGFTVVEAVVALTIFIVVSAGAVTAVVEAINANNATRNRVAAANIAQSDLEQARAVPTPASTAYATTAPNGNSTYSVSRTVTLPSPSGTASCPIGSVKQIVVTVGWPGSGSVTAGTVVAC